MNSLDIAGLKDVAYKLCSTPFGIIEVITAQQFLGALGVNKCSTPIGI